MPHNPRNHALMHSLATSAIPLLPLAICHTTCMSQPATEAAPMTLCSPRPIELRLDGPLGQRVVANVDNWLLPAPLANPGMLEMFRLRDCRPVPDLVPWAGEFVGKYLISAIQACRMSDDARLKPFVAEIISELITTQAEDGYLGPFRKEERLLGHWDLWGHYHCMLALLMWYEDTGDRSALDCAVRVADLVCNTFLDTDKRVWDAGSHEMNMAVIHSLGHLYRIVTSQRLISPDRADRYLRMMREIEKDWERPPAGDYLRTGLAGLDFYRCPKPRWESLHDLQGLVELYRITGDERYKRAFIQHWTSIRNYDRHPSGGFTTGEQAIGNPYSDGAIETCCTTAWMALTVDMLRLTGDPAAADELELSTWNSMIGSQHPSGRWWTYNTPLDGIREASAHTIVFQSRFGTPELNCCSVNGPRGLGMLSEWAVMLDAQGPLINYYGPGEARLQLSDGTPLTLRQHTQFPADGKVRIVLGLADPRAFTLRLRLPAWSADTAVSVNGQPAAQVTGSVPSYLPLARTWRDGDTIEITFDMSLRSWTGELSKRDRAAIYRGPLLLAFDQKFSDLDTGDIPTLDLSDLRAEPTSAEARFRPLVLLRLKAQDGRQVVLCDFATAGAHGTHYRAWLPAVNGRPVPFHLKRPQDGQRIAPCPVLFEWTGYRSSAQTGRRFRLQICADEGLSQPVLTVGDLERPKVIVREGLEPGRTYWWRVTATNANGETESSLGPRQFTIDPALPNTLGPEAQEPMRGPGDLIVASPLDGNGEPSFGALEQAANLAPAESRSGQTGKALAFDGHSSRLVYAVPEFPEEDYTAAAWVCPEGLPTDRNHQIISAWAAPMDDPLRIVIVGSEVFARIEAAAGFGTAGVALQNGRWTHVAAVKRETVLELYVNGELKHTALVPHAIYSAARNIGVGMNPNYGGNECLLGKLDDFAFWARALTADEVAVLARGE